MQFNNITPLNSFAIHPDWSSFRTPGGLSLGEDMYELDENMPTHLYPIRGTVVASPDGSEVERGDEIFFTWNGVSFNKCISPIEKENIFILNQAAFAYKHDGVLKTLGDFLLLEPVSSDEQLSASGLIIGGYTIGGSLGNYRSDRINENVPLVGNIAVLPKPLDVYIGRPNVEIGEKVCIMITSDVRVKIDGREYYRTRFSELIFKYDSTETSGSN